MLNAKQRIFVAEYLVDKNATQAAIRAGYARTSAHSQAHDLLKKPEISDAIAKGIEKIEKKVFITAERVVQELARLATFDVRKIYNEQGAMKHPHEFDDDTAAAVAGIDIFEEYEGFGKDREKIGETKKIRTSDKVRSLEILAKHFKLVTEKVEHSGMVASIGVPVEQVEKMFSNPEDTKKARDFAMMIANMEEKK